MQNKENFVNPIGVYRHPASKVELGAIDPAQADAFVRAGFRLVKECANQAEVMEASKEKPEAPAAPVQAAK